MAKCVPIDPLPPTYSTETDNVTYWEACKKFRKFFPDKLCLDLLVKTAEGTLPSPDLLDRISGFCKKVGLTEKTFNEKFAESELPFAVSSLTEDWISSLFRLGRNESIQYKRLDDELFPLTGTRKEIATSDLIKYLLKLEYVTAVIEEFAKNLKVEIDKSPDGLVVLPRNSHGMEVRIKKDENGYYLGDTQVN